MNKKIKISRAKARRIRRMLWKAGFDSVAELARAVGFSRTWTSLVLYDHAQSEEARKVISEALKSNPWIKRKAA